jgi:predicted nucleic acid-binding protein
MARELILKYVGAVKRKRVKNDSLDLPDAINIVVAAHEETTIIATLDGDYRQVKPLVGLPYFTLLPADSKG